MILAIYYFATHGNSVDVHIGRAHKDGYLQTLIIKIFCIKDLLYHYHLSICGANYLRMTYGKITPGRTEEGNDEKEKNDTCNNYYPEGEGHYITEIIKKTGIDKPQ
jgi:hypothetical protein